MPPMPNRLARTIKQFRRQRGLTQDALAKKAGLALAYIGRMEISRHNDPKVSTLRKLAKALKVKMWELME